MELVPLIKKLSESTGISGRENEIGAIVREVFAPLSDAVDIDQMGSIMALRHGARKPPRRRAMLAAHMDEIGLMVSGIEGGFLRVSSVGGIDARVMPAQEVIVHGQKKIAGVIASQPPQHTTMADRKKTIPLEQLWVDVGLSQAQARRRIQIGDAVTLNREVVELKGNLLAGKAFDDRVSVAAMAVCFEALAAQKHDWDVMAVATVQEEITLLGAATSAFKHRPDLAIVLDVTFGVQEGAGDVGTFPLGKGPAVSIGPNMHPKISERLQKTAQQLEMNVHIDPLPGASGTDAWSIQVAAEGVPCGLLGIPLRSMHTPVETVAVKDVERTGRLLAEFIVGLDEAFYQSLND
jgi:endoglucanase